MAFVNLSLLIGGLLAAIPIVLHLTMRQQPKRMVFPALQFLQQRQESNRRELQIRHWLLLALRCAVVGLLALALARPSVAAEALRSWLFVALLAGLAGAAVFSALLAAAQRRGKLLVTVLSMAALALLLGVAVLVNSALSHQSAVVLGDQQAPVAAVLLFDTSPRMQYRFQNQTRLERAQETASWLLRQLPPESDVAVLTGRPGPAVFSVDLAAAENAVERLQTSGISHRLSQVLPQAVELAQNRPRQRKEVYVFTDMSQAAWQDEDGALQEAIEEAEDVGIYIVDVGAEEPRNLSLGPLELSSQNLVRNDELRVTTEVRSLGVEESVEVELYVEKADPERPVLVDGEMLTPEAVRRDRRKVQLGDGDSRRVELSVRGLPPGVHQGFVKIAGSDSLEVDDTRYFTVEVQDAWPVLVVAPEGAETAFVTEAIAPLDFRRTDQARFTCTVARQSDLPNRNLDRYAAVCLLDPEPLTPAVWQELSQYVEDGGGLAVFLGRNAMPTTSFNHRSATRVLGGTLKRQWRAGGRDLFVAPQRLDHPILAPFREQSTSVPWRQAPVRRHWVLEDLGPETRVVARYNNNKPALAETALGNGRALTMTTPLSDPNFVRGREPWLELTKEDWPYFVLLNEMFLYLVEGQQDKLNYVAGEPAVLMNEAQRSPQRYQLFPPSEQVQDVTAQDRELAVRLTEEPGPYRLKGFRGGPVIRGFAVNLAPQHSELQRLARSQMDELLGQDRYRYARNRAEIEVEVGHGRVGHEFYPYLLVILALVLAMEHLMANRFYRREAAKPPQPRGVSGVLEKVREPQRI